MVQPCGLESISQREFQALSIAGFGRPELPPERRPGGGFFQELKGSFDDGMLALRIVGFVQRIAVPERQDQSAGRADALGNLSQELKGDSGNALAFQLRRDQTHGLVAHRSDRDQQSGIDMISHQPAGRLWRCLFH